MLGAFVSGYTPTNTTGIVTATTGRVVTTIDDKPAAEVYNAWTNGSIKHQLAGGPVLHETVLKPLGRIVDKVGSVRRYLLAHPHQVMPGGGLLFFSEMKGDRANDAVSSFRQQIGEAPFIGAATFGEVGCFSGTRANRHGNFMCDTVLFEGS